MPTIDELNDLLAKKRAGQGVKVSKLTEVELEKAGTVMEVTVNGLG